jgi:aminopeptidase N
LACLHHRAPSLGLGRLADRQSHVAADGPMPFAEPGVEPHYAPSRQVAIEHLAVRLELFPAERRFAGEARLRLRALGSFRDGFALDLDDVAIEAVTDGNGAPLGWVHEQGQIRVRCADLPAEVVVRWSGRDPTRGLYFTGPTAWAPQRSPMAWTQCQDEDAHFLLPCHDHPGVKHPWSIELWGPKGFTLLSNGASAGGGEQGDRVYARFEQKEPMPAYLFTAVCAQLSTHRAEPVQLGDRTVEVRYLVPTGRDEAVDRAMGRTPEMIRAFSQLIGVDYPWPRYDQVVVDDFVFGGMENIACTTMIDALLVDERSVREWEPDALVSHELAHQWFGDLVTCRDWSQGWLNESWATFMEFAWWEISRPVADATWYRWENFETYLEEAGGRYKRPIISYDFREPIDVFDRHLYEKGGLVLATLRSDLGDVAFWTGVRHYLQRNRHGAVHTRDFQAALEAASGVNLDRFFQQWLHSPGHPVAKVKLRCEAGLLTVTVAQTQAGEGIPAAYAFPLTLEVIGDGGVSQRYDLPVRERDRTWAIPVSGAITTVRVDPGFRGLVELSVDAPEAWLARLAQDACPVLALRAVRALLEADTGTAWNAVHGALRDHPFPGVRMRVAALLGERGGPAARDALLGALADADPLVRRAVCDALAGFRETAVADALIAVLDGQPDTWHLLGSALVALGKTRDPRAVGVIGRFLDTPAWHDLVRIRAVGALAATEDPAVLDTLVARSQLAYPDRLRGAAALALGRLADRVEPVRRRAVERLVEMLAEPGFFSQMQAVDALGIARDASGLAGLANVHRTAPDGRTRRHAYEAMARIRAGKGAEEAVGALRRQVEKLGEENHKLRERIERLERPVGSAGA